MTVLMALKGSLEITRLVRLNGTKKEEEA